MTKIVLDIEGMSCDHCVRAVRAALEAVDGVQATTVTVGHAEVEAREGTSRDAVTAAIEHEGYRVTVG